MLQIKNIYTQLNESTRLYLDNRLKYPVYNIPYILFYRNQYIYNINIQIKKNIPYKITILKNIKNTLLSIKSLYSTNQERAIKELNKLTQSKEYKHLCLFNNNIS